jgi:hypothetical protein
MLLPFQISLAHHPPSFGAAAPLDGTVPTPEPAASPGLGTGSLRGEAVQPAGPAVQFLEGVGHASIADASAKGWIAHPPGLAVAGRGGTVRKPLAAVPKPRPVTAV